MLSYRHGFHAGNFADVHKHAVLTLLLSALKEKDKAFFYLDTHGGAGRYDLESAFARKNREHDEGIGRLWGGSDWPSALQDYYRALKSLNPDDVLRYYPGSPWLARQLLRPQDRMAVSEKHSTEIEVLRAEFAGDQQVAVHHEDAYQAVKAFLPPRERRGLVLFDPAYELKDEFERVAEGLSLGWQRWQTGTFAIWYPLRDAGTRARFERMLVGTGVRKMLRAELCLRPIDTAQRLNGSGMIVVNPPWKLKEQLGDLQPWLHRRLGDGAIERSYVDWLVPE